MSVCAHMHVGAGWLLMRVREKGRKKKERKKNAERRRESDRARRKALKSD